MGGPALACPIQAQNVFENLEKIQLPTRQSSPPDRLFANNVRFLSMVAIVGMHTIETYEGVALIQSETIASECLIQFLKFGTIGFFLISGFLLGDRIHQYSSTEYLRRRLKNVFAPWLAWFALYCVLGIATKAVLGSLAPLSLSTVCNQLKFYLLQTAYWFVPNLIIALAILLAFKRHLHRPWIGFLYLAASLFYAANIYGRWIAVEHARAVFGFIFYLWLGVWSSLNFAAIEKRLARIPVIVVLGAVLFSLALAIAETKLLAALGSADPFNTLRLTNQIYSVVFVLAILKFKSAVWPRMVDVRQDTFAIYLAHPFFLTAGYSILKRAFIHFSLFRETRIALSWLIVPVLFMATYGGCLLIVRISKPFRILRWTIGIREKKSSATQRYGGARLDTEKTTVKPFEIGAQRRAPGQTVTG